MLNVLPTLDLLDTATDVYWDGAVTTVMSASSVPALRVTALNVSRMESGPVHIIITKHH